MFNWCNNLSCMHSVPMFCFESAAKSQVGLNSDTSEQIPNYASSALREWWKKCLYSSIMSKISLSSLLITSEHKYVLHIRRDQSAAIRSAVKPSHNALPIPCVVNTRSLTWWVCEIVFMLCYIFSLTGFANFCIHICPSLPLCWR